MKFCCNVVTSLGCFDSCAEAFDTGLLADASGEWNIYAEFAGSAVKMTVALEEGDAIIFPNKLNEDYTHVLKIIRPNGTLYQGKCYSITTFTTLNL